MRLFIAIDLDEAARAAIAKEQERIASVIDREKTLTWAAPGRMHLTLVFLGEVPDAAAAAIVDVAGRSIGAEPFDAAFAGIGVFPPDGSRKPPRVLWLGVTAGAEGIAAIRRETAARLTAVGAPIEDRPFNPHLTLARWRRSTWSDRRRVEAIAHGDVIARVIARIRVDHTTLYQSRLSSAGPSYTALARANLRGQA
ncbi:MAG TPA: RNA 2',3'-cyclic phosphodiesterase, partial [Vicinamibacterales bacterium]|nr:RNA 2',3'-cyclic phosphodiesterase [Vicinamibacterales bacterium]